MIPSYEGLYLFREEIHGGIKYMQINSEKHSTSGAPRILFRRRELNCFGGSVLTKRHSMNVKITTYVEITEVFW